MIDPAAGAGALLGVVGRAYQTTGIEIDAGLAEQGRSQADRFYTGDGLLGTLPEVADETFDCVLANPPFGKLGPMLPLFGTDGPCRLAQRFELLDGQKQMRSFPVELLFVERALQLTRPAGWMALILPEGFLANARRQGARDWLLAHAEVRAVVALPGAFNKVQTALVVLRRSKPLARTKARLIAPVGKRPSEQYAQHVRLLLSASARRAPEAALSERRSARVACPALGSALLAGARRRAPLGGPLATGPVGRVHLPFDVWADCHGQPSSARRGWSAGHPAGQYRRNRARRARAVVRRSPQGRTIPRAVACAPETCCCRGLGPGPWGGIASRCIWGASRPMWVALSI